MESNIEAIRRKAKEKINNGVSKKVDPSTLVNWGKQDKRSADTLSNDSDTITSLLEQLDSISEPKNITPSSSQKLGDLVVDDMIADEYLDHMTKAEDMLNYLEETEQGEEETEQGEEETEQGEEETPVEEISLDDFEVDGDEMYLDDPDTEDDFDEEPSTIMDYAEPEIEFNSTDEYGLPDIGLMDLTEEKEELEQAAIYELAIEEPVETEETDTNIQSTEQKQTLLYVLVEKKTGGFAKYFESNNVFIDRVFEDVEELRETLTAQALLADANSSVRTRIVIIETGVGKFTSALYRKEIISIIGLSDVGTDVSVFYSNSSLYSSVKSALGKTNKADWIKYNGTIGVLAKLVGYKERYIRSEGNYSRDLVGNAADLKCTTLDIEESTRAKEKNMGDILSMLNSEESLPVYEIDY